MPQTLWILEETDVERFPYRITIRRGEETLLRLFVQGRWPGARGNIFCLREVEETLPPPLVEVEHVPVVSMRRFGRRLAVVLDRRTRKRCDFLFLTKRYKTKPGEYEQIFWRTEHALHERRPRVKLTTYAARRLSIAIDVNERYPWKFAGHTVSRENLPVGDYALLDRDGRPVAIVERKTFPNLLAEFGRMAAFHQQLSELEAFRQSALVIEAAYADFLSPKKMPHYGAAFGAKAIAELQALHPALAIAFTGNRKLGQEWARRFFAAVDAHRADTPHPAISEVVAEYGEVPEATGGRHYDIRRVIVEAFPARFTRAEMRAAFPGVPDEIVTRVLHRLRDAGRVRCHGRGRGAWWERVAGASPGLEESEA
jgi:hypothetical protein